MSFKQQQNFSNGLEKSHNNKNYVSDSNHSANRNEFYENEFRGYGNDHPGRELPINTESQLEYRTLAKQ